MSIEKITSQTWIVYVSNQIRWDKAKRLEVV